METEQKLVALMLKVIPNEKVLLCEYKTHTVHCIASTRYDLGREVYPIQ